MTLLSYWFSFSLFYALINDFSSLGRSLLLDAFHLCLKVGFVSRLLFSLISVSSSSQILSNFVSCWNKKMLHIWRDVVWDKWYIPLSCLLSRSGSIRCPFACLWWEQHSVIAGTATARKEIENAVFSFYTQKYGAKWKRERRRTLPINVTSSYSLSLLALCCSVITLSLVTTIPSHRWFKLFSASSCFFCVPCLWGDLTLKSFNQNSDSLQTLR